MKNERIIIEKPCHMKWKDMEQNNTPDSKHCTLCAIDLVDFTKMSNEEIIAYLQQHKNEKICAHMHTYDAQKSLTKHQKIVLRWHKHITNNVTNRVSKSILLAIVGLMVLCTGCSMYSDGEPAIECHDEYRPDTTTTDPTDSAWNEVCEPW